MTGLSPSARSRFATHWCELFFRDEKLQLLERRDEAILSGRPAAEVERRGIGRLELREILLAVPYTTVSSRLNRTGISFRTLVCHPPLC